jgi:hypothetical protein
MIAAHGRGWMKARATALARVLGLEPPSGTCRYDLPRYRVQSPRATPRQGSERAAPRHLAVESSRWCRHASVERRTCPPRRRASHPFRCPATRQVGFGLAPAFVEQCRHVPPGDTRRFTHRGAGHRSGSTHRHLPGVLQSLKRARTRDRCEPGRGPRQPFQPPSHLRRLLHDGFAPGRAAGGGGPEPCA